MPASGLRRVGVMMFETIGDTLLASTLIASLRAHDPAVEVIVFASAGNEGILPSIEGIHSVVIVPLTHPIPAIAAMRSVPVDVMIDIGQWPRWYAVLCVAARSRHTVGFATPGQWRHYAYDSAVRHRGDVHELQNFQNLLEPLGVAPVGPGQALKAVGVAPAAIADGGPYMVVHPWASGFNHTAREWPPSHWVALIQRVTDRGFRVLVAGGPADRTQAAELVERCPDPEKAQVQSIAGALSLQEVAAVLKGAEAVVSVNTGIMHLAAILDVPLVALHGPTNRRRWGPIGARSVALAPPPGEHAEFLNLGFEYPRGRVDCMARIGVDEVLSALQSLSAMSARAAIEA